MVSEAVSAAGCELTVGTEFVDMLSSMRLGHLNPQLIAKFQQLSRPLVYDDGIDASVL